MSAFLAELRRVAGDLDGLGARWALVGALAYSVHAEPRTTKDIDAALAVSGDDEIERIAVGLVGRGYGDKQLLLTAGPVRRLGIRVAIPTSRPYSIPLDLLSCFSGIEQEVVENAISVELLPALFMPVACLGHVLAMKILSQNDSDRVRDKADINALILNSSERDLEVAREALGLITARGFNRDKHLMAELDNCLAAARRDATRN